MNVGDKVRITEEAWARFCAQSGEHLPNPGVRVVEDIQTRDRPIMLDYPSGWWGEGDLQEVNVVHLDAVRIREDREFEDEKVAYVEALWGKETFAFNAAIRDLEAMRRGHEDLTLRPPQTYHEAAHLILHVRALANDMARHFGIDDLVRPEDEIGGSADG